MKTTTIIIGTLAVGAGLVLAIHQLLQTKPQSCASPIQRPAKAAVDEDAPATPPPSHRPRVAEANVEAALPIAPTRAANGETKPAQPPAFAIAKAADWVTSPQTTFQKKQEIWHYLAATGQIDAMIAELEQRAVSQPDAPEIPAALGQAYLQKCAVLKDVREQGMFGLKADQVFDSALKLDPHNWDARFWKACAMAHWPPQLNKGQEVMESFTQLMELQEMLPAQPHYAETYLWLGQVYDQYGQVEQARQAWQRGLRWFPESESLRKKLQPQPTASVR
jgi:tetratricopeptide (TPR) repeat protein